MCAATKFVGGRENNLLLIGLLEGLLMKDLLLRHGYRISLNFMALVLIQFTWEVISVPIFYVYGLTKWGWYWPDGWYYGFMIQHVDSFTFQFAMIALILVVIWEIFRAVFLLSRSTFNASMSFSRKFLTRT